MRCGWEKSTQGDVRVWVQVSTHTVLFPYFSLLPRPLPSCVAANPASKLLPTQTHLHLQLLELGGCARVGSMGSRHSGFPRTLVQTRTTLLVK